MIFIQLITAVHADFIIHVLFHLQKQPVILHHLTAIIDQTFQ